MTVANDMLQNFQDNKLQVVVYGKISAAQMRNRRTKSSKSYATWLNLYLDKLWIVAVEILTVLEGFKQMCSMILRLNIYFSIAENENFVLSNICIVNEKLCLNFSLKMILNTAELFMWPRWPIIVGLSYLSSTLLGINEVF